MHILSRKDLHSAELETVRVPRTPTTVIAANCEVRTNEEVTVYVNDLNLFVTVQILEDTPAVPSPGKLCEDHGYAYEWTIGQKPHFFLSGKKIQCNTDNYVPIVVPVLSSRPSCSSTSTSSTSVSQDSMEGDSTPRPATTRSRSTRSRSLGDQLQDSTETEHKNKSEEIDRVRRSPLRDLPEWCEEFTENLPCEEASASNAAPARISRDPLHQEPFYKNWYPGSPAFFAHFPKAPKFRSTQKNQDHKGSCRKRTGNQVLKADKFGDLITRDHKCSMKIVNLETITGVQSWYRIWSLNGCNHIRAKLKFLRSRNNSWKRSVHFL